jgi:hypothetical protein
VVDPPRCYPAVDNMKLSLLVDYTRPKISQAVACCRGLRHQ